MRWILQDNLYNEPGYQKLVGVLDRLGLPHTVVKPVPFTDRLIPYDFDTSKAQSLDDIPEPKIPTDERIFVSGSYTLAKIAVKRGWEPGAFLEGLRYDEYSKGWNASRLLNPGATISKLRDAEIPGKAAFVKPVEDSKAFSGQVFGKAAFRKWRDQVIGVSEADVITDDTEVIISKPVKIYNEARLWVVEGAIATASTYKVGNKIVYSEIVDDGILVFGQDCINEWIPNKAFVLDIATTEDGFKIVEVNNLNSAGLYAADVQKLVIAIESITKYDFLYN